MSSPSTARNFLLALVLSITAGIFLAAIYAFYPVIAAIVSAFAASRAGDGSGGIGAVAGGVGESLLWAALVAVPVLFLIFFALFQRRRAMG